MLRRSVQQLGEREEARHIEARFGRQLQLPHIACPAVEHRLQYSSLSRVVGRQCQQPVLPEELMQPAEVGERRLRRQWQGIAAIEAVRHGDGEAGCGIRHQLPGPGGARRGDHVKPVAALDQGQQCQHGWEFSRLNLLRDPADHGLGLGEPRLQVAALAQQKAGLLVDQLGTRADNGGRKTRLPVIMIIGVTNGTAQ